MRAVAAGHAFVHNLRREHYEVTVDVPVHDRVRVAFTDLAFYHAGRERSRTEVR